MQADEVGLAQHRLHRIAVLVPVLLLQVLAPVGVVVDHLHLEAGPPAGHRGPDPPQPHQAQGGVVHVLAQESQGLPGLPLVVQDVLLGLGQHPGGGHQQGEGQVGGGVREDVRGVGADHPPPGHLRDHEVVEAHRQVGHHLELGAGRVQQLGVDALGEEGQNPVRPAHGAEQLIAGDHLVPLPLLHVPPALLAQLLGPHLRDVARDEDFGHGDRSPLYDFGLTRAQASSSTRRQLAIRRSWRSPGRGRTSNVTTGRRVGTCFWK